MKIISYELSLTGKRSFSVLIRGIDIKFSHVVIAAKGYKKVKSAEIAKISEDKKELGKIEKSSENLEQSSGSLEESILKKIKQK